MLQTIDNDQLANVTGGGGFGNFLAGFDQILGFLQSEPFGNIVGGLRQLIAGFAGLQPQGGEQDQAQQLQQQQQQGAPQVQAGQGDAEG
jgi:hypothetical protein